MKLELIFRHLDATDGLRKHTEDKVEKLKKYLIKPTHMKIIFDMDRHLHTVNITLLEKGKTFHAEGKTTDMYASVDQAMHGLHEQLRRYKEKTKGHKNYERSKEGRLRGAQSMYDEEHLSATASYYNQKKKKVA